MAIQQPLPARCDEPKPLVPATWNEPKPPVAAPQSEPKPPVQPKAPVPAPHAAPKPPAPEQAPHHPQPASNISPAQSEALKIHNQAREAVSKQTSVHRPDLIWDSKLTAAAEQWAQYLASRDAGLQHSSGAERPGQGENLFWISAGGSLATGSQAWVDERKAYHGEKIGEGNFESYGHYTQVIWPSTTHVGVASAKTKSGANFIVGRYSPPGNFTGESAYTGH
ncbi:CAP domain-containing protein [Usnea florida]